MKIDGIRSAFQHAQDGIQRGVQGLNETAAEIAGAIQHNSNGPEDYAQSMVDLMQYRNAIQASAKAYQRADNALEFFLNTLA